MKLQLLLKLHTPCVKKPFYVLLSTGNLRNIYVSNIFSDTMHGQRHKGTKEKRL